jgi:CBS domain containing-hemolysin-like protein
VVYGLIIIEVLAPFWKFTGINDLDKSGSLQLFAEVILSTLIVLLVVFFFRAIFRAKTDSILSAFAKVMEFFYALFNPIALLFVSVSTGCLNTFLMLKWMTVKNHLTALTWNIISSKA